jgi:hypothetical protein
MKKLCFLLIHLILSNNLEHNSGKEAIDPTCLRDADGEALNSGTTRYTRMNLPSAGPG